MTRNRQVWPREQVAHLWANASQDSARDPSGNMYFTGAALYSYGSHYVIGYRYATPDGSAFFILNADTNSPTTNKMRGIASHAIARFYARVHVGGLDGNAFSGRDWRARMMREALAQGGRLYAQASAVSRVSLKRDSIVSEAGERIRAAQTLADAVMADKERSADDKRAARATLATLAKVAAVEWPRNADNASERAACDALASLLVRDEQRAKLARIVADVVNAADNATGADGFNRSAVRRYDAAAAGLESLRAARDLAKRYGFRMPRVPDMAAIAADLKPAADAARLAVALDDAREALERAESAARLVRDNPGWHASSVTRYASQVGEAATAARSYGGDVPAWMAERAERLIYRANRAQRFASLDGSPDRIGSTLDNGDRRAATDAVGAGEHYRRALRDFDSVAAALVEYPRHPAAARLESLRPQRDAAAQFVATLAERLEKENAERIAAWRDGVDSRPTFRAHAFPPMLRLSADGRTIETSHGAIVPATIAPRLWRLIESARGGDAAKVSAAFRGLHVGPFTLAEIRADGSAVIGCHDIPHAEMQRLAARLNLHA